MFLAVAFLTFFVSHIFFSGFYLFASFLSVLFLFSIGIIFKYKIIGQKQRVSGAPFQKEMVSALLGVLMGVVYAFYLNLGYSEIDDDQKIKNTREGRVAQISKKSVVIEYTENQKKYRLRVLGDIYGLNLFKGNLVLFSCDFLFSERGGPFSFTQKLQKISRTCRGSIQKKEKSLHSPLEKVNIRVKSWIKARIDQFPKGTLAAGFILADTSGIPMIEMRFFRKMGIAHLFAVSGLHLGLLFAICYLPFFWLKIPRYGEILGFLFCTFFLLLLDFPTSLLRAYLFLLLYLGLKLIDRKTSPFHIFFFVACCSELIYPLSAFSYSFVLSFGITGSILLAFPFFRKILPIRFRYLKDHLSLTLAAFTGSVFLSPLLFEYVNLLSLLYNFLLVPLAGIYLFTTLLSILFTDVSQVLFFFDQIFHYSAFMHLILWERFFTTVHWHIVYIWLFLLFILFILVCILMLKKKQWYVRKYFLPVSLVLILVYSSQFFLIRYPASGFKAFPYGVLFYKDKQLYVMGELASFISIKDGGGRFFNRPEVPVRKIYAGSPKLESLLQGSTPLSHEKIASFSYERRWNVLKWKDQCFLFASRKFNMYYARKNTRGCKDLYIIGSKKRKKELKHIQTRLKEKMKNVSISTAGFNRWYWEGVPK